MPGGTGACLIPHGPEKPVRDVANAGGCAGAAPGTGMHKEQGMGRGTGYLGRKGMLGCAMAGMIAAAMVAASGVAAADVIADRQAGFKKNLENMKAMAAALKAGEVKTMQGHAEAIAAYAATIPSLFPPGSGEGDTEALPTIWQDWDGFVARAKANGEAADALAKVAAGGDAAAAGAALKALGGTCGACHDRFREKK